VSLAVCGLDLWPHGIYKLSWWTDSDSSFKLLKSSSYIYIYICIYIYLHLQRSSYLMEGMCLVCGR